MFLTVVVGIITLGSMSWAGDPCPPKKDLGRCFCSYGDIDAMSSTTSMPSTPTDEIYEPVSSIDPNYYLDSAKKFFHNYHLTTVTCNAPSSFIGLEEVILAFHRKTVDKLVLSRIPPQREHTLSVLPNKWLRNTRVKQFEIKDTILAGDFIAFGDPFEGQEQSLLWFTATHCSLYGALTGDTQDSTHTKGLKKLSYLEGLDLSYNHLTTVSNSAFSSPPVNLTTLILSYNSLKVLESSCFSSIPKLKYIDLSHNLLESVTRAMFYQSYVKLEHIDLGWNFLKTIPSDFFSNMNFLKTVKLEKNFLYSMPERVWRSVWRNLAFVNVTGNFIHCDCDLLWLLPLIPERDFVRTGQTVLGKCTQDNFPNVTEHNLATLTHNQLKC